MQKRFLRITLRPCLDTDTKLCNLSCDKCETKIPSEKAASDPKSNMFDPFKLALPEIKGAISERIKMRDY